MMVKKATTSTEASNVQRGKDLRQVTKKAVEIQQFGAHVRAPAWSDKRAKCRSRSNHHQADL